MRNTSESIFIADHRGMVGSAVVRRLRSLGYTHLLTATHAELDLTDQAVVRAFFAHNKIDRVVLAAARSAAPTPRTPIRPSSSTRT